MTDQFTEQEPGAAAQQASEAQSEGLSQEQHDRAQRVVAFMAHPHTQLTGILKDVNRPSALDVNGRVGILQQAVARLTQLMLSTVEAPRHPDAPEEEAHEVG